MSRHAGKELGVISILKSVKDMNKELTLDDVITEAEKKMEEKGKCGRCKRKNTMIVSWLKELQDYRKNNLPSN